MRRTPEGWFLLLLTAPLLLWGLTQISVYLVSLIGQVEISFGKPLPPLIDLAFLWVFTAPVAAGAYHWATQTERKKRLLAATAMGVPLTVLFLMNFASSVGEWALFSALQLALVTYGLLTLLLASKISAWQA